MSYWEKRLLGRNVSLREKIGEKCLLGRKVLGRNVLGRKVFWGETSEYHFDLFFEAWIGFHLIYLYPTVTVHISQIFPQFGL